MNPNILKSSAIPAMVIGLGTSLLTGCGVSSEGATQQTHCYEANIDGPALPSLRNALKTEGYKPTSLSGVVDTAYRVNDILESKHHKYSLVIPGDKFSFCVTGKKVSPGSIFETAE